MFRTFESNWWHLAFQSAVFKPDHTLELTEELFEKYKYSGSLPEVLIDLGWGPGFKSTSVGNEELLKIKWNMLWLKSVAQKCSLMDIPARKTSREVP